MQESGPGLEGGAFKEEARTYRSCWSLASGVPRCEDARVLCSPPGTHPQRSGHFKASVPKRFVCTEWQLKELDIYQFEISLAKKKREERERHTHIENMRLGEDFKRIHHLER